MRACPWSESVGEGGGGGVIRITVEPSVAANWVTEGSYIRVYVGRYTLRTASATLLSTRRFRNPSQPPGILLWSARQNATQNPPSTAIGFRPTHYPFCRPFNLIRHDRHWQHDNRVTWQYFDKDSLRRNICRLQFACVYHHYDGYSNRRPMKGLSNFDAQRFNQVRASSDPWNFSYNQIFSRYETKYYPDTRHVGCYFSSHIFTLKRALLLLSIPTDKSGSFCSPEPSLSRPNARPETQPADSRVTLQLGFDKRTSVSR